jgi:regulatory protein
MQNDPLREKAEKKAYRLLALRGHSEKELREKLRRGGFAESLVDGVISKCREFGYLDDQKFTRQRVRELAVNRLLGDRRIVADLHEKGIPEADCREAIAAVREELGEEEAIEKMLRKKRLGAVVAGMDGRQKARVARSLLGRGFPTGLIFKKIGRIQEEGVHDDDGE